MDQQKIGATTNKNQPPKPSIQIVADQTTSVSAKIQSLRQPFSAGIVDKPSLSPGDPGLRRRKSEAEHDNRPKSPSRDKLSHKRPSVTSLIQKFSAFDASSAETSPKLPLPRRKSFTRSTDGGLSPAQSISALAKVVQPNLLSKQRSVSQSNQEIGSINISEITLVANKLKAQTTEPEAESAHSGVRIMMSDFDLTNNPVQVAQDKTQPKSLSAALSIPENQRSRAPSFEELSLKPKPQVKMKNLSRSNATGKTKRKPFQPSGAVAVAAFNRIPRLEYGYNQFDVLVVLRFLSVLSSVLTDDDVDPKLDDGDVESFRQLIQDYAKFISHFEQLDVNLIRSESDKDRMHSYLESLNSAMDASDYQSARMYAILTALEYQEVNGVIPIKYVDGFKIEGCSAMSFETACPYTWDVPEAYEIVNEILGRNMRKYTYNWHSKNSGISEPTKIVLEQFELDGLAYRRFFSGRDHRNYLGLNDKFGEFAISIRKEQIRSSGTFYRVLFRAKNMHKINHFLIPENDINVKHSGSGNEVSDKTYKAIIAMIYQKLDVSKMKKFDISVQDPMEMNQRGLLSSPVDSSATKIEKSFAQLDQHKTAFGYKFGIMYVHPWQSEEVEWFNNVVPIGKSKSYDNFCRILGDIVTLAGHDGFKGGLDPKKGQTGIHSVYTKVRYNFANNELNCADFPPFYATENLTQIDFEIMYHCCTMLPFTDGDEQQIQRKRHIGNDLVSFVFIEGTGHGESVEQRLNELKVEAPFDPTKIRTQFLHVYIIVQEVMIDRSIAHSNRAYKSTIGQDAIPAYRIYTTASNDVPFFGPSLPDPPIFPIETVDDRQKVREFLLEKALNAENAAYHAKKFTTLHGRTYRGLLEAMWQDFADYKEPKAHRTSAGESQKKDSFASLMGLKAGSRRSSNTPSANTPVLSKSHSGTDFDQPDEEPTAELRKEPSAPDIRSRTVSDKVAKSHMIASAMQNHFKKPSLEVVNRIIEDDN